jgi:hypothetical protein
VNNKFTRIVDFWLDSIVTGFITEFVAGTTNPYSAAEQEFIRGPRGSYIQSLYTSVKILLYKKGVMTMEGQLKLPCMNWGRGGNIDREGINGRR